MSIAQSGEGVKGNRKGFVYGLVDPRELEAIRYIGQTVETLKQRLIRHLWERDKKLEYDTYKNRWLRKLAEEGVDPLIVEVEATVEYLLDDREIYHIASFRLSGHSLTNETVGGESTKGHVHSEASKQKIRESVARAHRKNPRTEETKRRISESLKGRKGAWIGRKHTEESKAKIAAANRSRSQEVKDKISNTLKGHVQSEETAKRRTASRTKNFGEGVRKKLTKEQAKKIKRLIAESNLTQKEIGDMFGIGFATVSKIKLGKIWTDI